MMDGNVNLRKPASNFKPRSFKAQSTQSDRDHSPGSKKAQGEPRRNSFFTLAGHSLFIE